MNTTPAAATPVAGFDFDAAVVAPFRMQPGLRRLAPGAPHLTPAMPGGRHMREKLAVLSVFSPQALLCAAGFDAGPALQALAAQGATEHPGTLQVDGTALQALGVRVAADGSLAQTAPGAFGLGDEVLRCLHRLPAHWRRTGLLSLAFAEDFAIVDGSDGARGGHIPWLAVALPSHWAPQDKVGRSFAEVHAPVADGDMLRRAGAVLVQTVTGHTRWERFVWSLGSTPRLHAHPLRVERGFADGFDPARCWWRTERQTFLPLPTARQAVFTIRVEVTPLATAIDTGARAARLHAAVASMSPAVLGYRGLAEVRAPLLDWLAAITDAARAGDRCAAPGAPGAPGT